MNSAAFSLEGYIFDKVEMDLSTLKPKTTFNIDFAPSGKFDPARKQYKLSFMFSAKDDESGHDVVKVRCVANFVFRDLGDGQDIPDFFYTNSIAILFPYVRAFVSTVTLQANIQPVVLPTLNLTELKDVLKANTERI